MEMLGERRMELLVSCTVPDVGVEGGEGVDAGGPLVVLGGGGESDLLQFSQNLWEARTMQVSVLGASRNLILDRNWRTS